MRQIARRAQGRVIDFLEQRLDWSVVEANVVEAQDYDGNRVLELSITAEYPLDENGSDYRHEPGEERH